MYCVSDRYSHFPLECVLSQDIRRSPECPLEACLDCFSAFERIKLRRVAVQHVIASFLFLTTKPTVSPSNLRKGLPRPDLLAKIFPVAHACRFPCVVRTNKSTGFNLELVRPISLVI